MNAERLPGQATMPAETTQADREGKASSATCVPVTAAQVQQEMRALLSPRDWHIPCQQCAAVSNQLGVFAWSDNPTPEHLLAVARQLLHEPHMADTGDRWQHNWDHCDYSTVLAWQAAILGAAGVPSVLAWGAGHRADDTRIPATGCESCRAWQQDRAWARRQLRQAGLDPIVALGEQDRATHPVG